MKNKKKGFTLVELIVVLAILAILAAMLVPALTGYIDKANEKKIIAEARQALVAAQTLGSEAYAKNGKLNTSDKKPSVDDIKKLGEVKDELIIAYGEDGSVTSLIYGSGTKKGYYTKETGLIIS